MGAVQQALTNEPLRIDANPFVSGGVVIGRPVQTALAQVIEQIVLKTPVILVTGNAGTGKSLLAKLTTRACSDMGL